MENYIDGSLRETYMTKYAFQLTASGGLRPGGSASRRGLHSGGLHPGGICIHGSLHGGGGFCIQGEKLGKPHPPVNRQTGVKT